MNKVHVSEDYVERALALIGKAQLTEAEQLLDEALRNNFENDTVTTLLKYIGFWRERFTELEKKMSNPSQADYMLAQWGQFEEFAQRIGSIDERTIQSIRHCIFGNLKKWLEHQLGQAGADEGYILSRIARCHKGLGEYEKALNYLHAASHQINNRAETLAELGDCYALIQDMSKAKLLLREAFFISAKDVNLSVLESEMVQRLIRRLRENSISDKVLKEWLPVYAIIWGVFDLKRELRYNEYDALVQRVYALEREFGDTQEEELGARLINCYMHLIDHYMHVNETQSKIDETLLKIRSINPGVYNLYLK